MNIEELYPTDEENMGIIDRNSYHSTKTQLRLATHQAVDNAVKKLVNNLWNELTVAGREALKELIR